MIKYYHVIGCEKLSEKTNMILAEVDYEKGKGYTLEVRAVEYNEKYSSIGYVFSHEYYNIYYRDEVVLESCKRKGTKIEERANIKAKKIVNNIVNNYISRVAALSGVMPQIVKEEDWRN